MPLDWLKGNPRCFPSSNIKYLGFPILIVHDCTSMYQYQSSWSLMSLCKASSCSSLMPFTWTAGVRSINLTLRIPAGCFVRPKGGLLASLCETSAESRPRSAPDFSSAKLSGLNLNLDGEKVFHSHRTMRDTWSEPMVELDVASGRISELHFV